MKPSALALLVLLASIPLAAQPGTPPQSSRRPVADPSATVRVSSSGEQGVTIEVDGLYSRIMRRDGIVGIAHNAPRHFFQDDSTSIPGLRFVVGIPPEAGEVAAAVVTRAGDTLGLGLSSGERLLWGGSSRPDVTVEPGSNLYGLRTVVVRYRPVRLAGNRVVSSRNATIRLTWKRSGAKGGMVPAEITPVADNVLGDVVLNYPASRGWVMKSARPAPTRQAMGRMTSSGMAADAAISPAPDMGEAVVIMVPTEGIYRVKATDLSAAGVSAGLAIADLRITTRLEPVRFYVEDRNGNGSFDGDDFLEFHGWRNRSPLGFYWDETTDTNAFVLTWRGGPGPAGDIVAASGSGEAPALASYDSTLHAEEEQAYYIGAPIPGVGDFQTIHSSDRVQNERFFWRIFPYPERPSFFFNASPRSLPNDSVTVRFRVAGATFAQPYHVASFYLNDELFLGTEMIQDTTDRLFSYRVPSSYLINGRNKVTVVTDTAVTEPIPNKRPVMLSFDYIEVTGHWHPTTFTGVAAVRLAGGRQRLTIDGATEEPEVAIGGGRRMLIDSREKGFLFRLSSRQFEVPLRNNPMFTAQIDDDTVVQAAKFQFGTYIGEVDGNTGRLLRGEFFAVNEPAGAGAAASFVSGVANGNIVVAGFALGALTGALPDNVKSAFTALGSQAALRNDMGNASWTFVARKGSPETAQERYNSLPDNNNGVTLNALIPSPNGRYFRSAVTVEGAAGDEVVVGPVRTPRLRYHRSDELRNPANRADMLLITHRAFRSEAERLAAHRRTHDSLVVKVIDVDQVYDEFNSGIKSPDAIRDFLQFADQNWTSPKPTYVLLFGDASTDPERRLPNSKVVDYVPTWGIPSSDYMLTVYQGDTTFVSHQFIGRLSASSSADAATIVEKLLEYDGQAPQWWNKRFVMITGGSTVGEKNKFEREALEDMQEFILPKHFQGDTALVHRVDQTDPLPLVSEKEGPWAREEINKGALFVTYSGHGSGNVVELNYGFPEEFDNVSRYFVLATFSCQTGAYAESDGPVRNERFVFEPGKGAIAAIGGTSFSYIDLDREFRREYLSEITFDKQRVLGAILHNTKANLFSPYQDFWKFTFTGTIIKNAVTAYNLVGDPSMKIALRPTVELALQEKDLTVTDQAGRDVSLGDSIAVIGARLWNYGFPIDTTSSDTSIAVVATIVSMKGVEAYDTVHVHRLGRSADFKLELPITKDPGEYVIRIQADPERAVAGETYLPDNAVSFTLQVRGNQPLVLEPRPFGRVIGYDNVSIRMLNPPSGPGAEIVVDTVETFDSPARFGNASLGSMQLEELTTTWTFSIPQELRSARRFFWRAVATTGDIEVARLFPLIESFTVDPPRGEEYAIGGRRQMSYASNTGLVSDESGVGPGRRRVVFQVKSMGQNGFPLDIVFRKDGRPVRSGNYTGLNAIIVDPATGNVVSTAEFAWFAEPKPIDQNRFISYVRDTVKPGQIVMIGKRYAWGRLPDEEPGNREVKDALKLLGSSVADSIAENDTYILIGGKGIPPALRREVWIRADSLIAAGKNPPFLDSVSYPMDVAAAAGQVTLPAAGPAKAWRALNLDVSQSSPVSVTVTGVRRDGRRDSLMAASTLDRVDLSGVDAMIYPRMEFTVRFVNDTLSRLRAAYVDFDPTAELAIVPSSVRLEHDSVLQGDPGVFHATVVNLSGRFAADSVRMQILYDDESQLPPVEDRVTGRLAPLDSIVGTFQIPTDRLLGAKSFALSVNPADLPAELYRQNNRASRPLKVGSDNVTPAIAIYADGNRLMEGDYVNPEPQLEIRIYDNSQLKLDESSAVTMILDNEVITTSTPGASFKLGGKGELRGTFYYRPSVPLADGPHDVRLFTKDATGNEDRTDFIRFNVERDLHVKQVVNVPNPFQTKTTFTFMVTGAKSPVGGEIAIFTVAGRKIKSIPLSAIDLNVGFNRVEWDGLDADGDRLANGVYLYRVTVENGDSKDQVLEKIVVMR